MSQAAIRETLLVKTITSFFFFHIISIIYVAYGSVSINLIDYRLNRTRTPE